jgi:O-glycosyl hydrolase
MQQTYANQPARDRVDIVAGHLYGGDPRQKLTTARQLHKTIWMTESSDRHTLWDMESAVAWAKDIHDGLTGAEVNAWLWFTLLAGGADTVGSGLIGVLPGGGFKASPSFYALGNFSKFVRPGFVRIGATATGSPLVDGLDVSAYQGEPFGLTLVVVAINRNDEEMDVHLVLPQNVQRSVTQYITSWGYSLEPQGYQFLGDMVRIPGKSIVTYVATPLAVGAKVHPPARPLPTTCDRIFLGPPGTSDLPSPHVDAGMFAEWMMAQGPAGTGRDGGRRADDSGGSAPGT